MRRGKTQSRTATGKRALGAVTVLAWLIALAAPAAAHAQAPDAARAQTSGAAYAQAPAPAHAQISAPARAQIFVDLGVQTTNLSSKIANIPGNVSQTDSSVHLGVGVRRSVGERSDFGVRLEVDEIGSSEFFAVRPLDYRRNISDKLAWTGFFGVARLALGTPAYGWYLGGGLQVKNVLPSWDLGMDLRYGDKLARDNVLPSDPKGGSPDNFHSVYGFSIYLSYRF